MIGKELDPILVDIENAILEFDAFVGMKPNYSDDGFRAAVKIFMSTIMDKMFDKQMNDKKTLYESMEEAELVGNKLRELILEHTGIDTYKFYE